MPILKLLQKIKKTTISNMKLYQYRLKKKYRNILDILSDEDKIEKTFQIIQINTKESDNLKTYALKYVNKIDDILTYYELKDHPLHKILAAKSTDPFVLFLYTKIIVQNRWPEVEVILKEYPHFAFLYAKEILQGRFYEAEDNIKNNAYLSYCYSRTILENRRWIKAEKVIKKSPIWAYHYAKDVIKGRWYEAESVIKTNSDCSYEYAANVIKSRWMEAEETIKKDPDYWQNYKTHFKIDG